MVKHKQKRVKGENKREQRDYIFISRRAPKNWFSIMECLLCPVPSSCC
jgi:hypothetical protein